MSKRIVQRQAGFTLIEIAIVLVIIGLLLGGILKGQELIENAKIKRLVNDMTGTTAAYYGYRDRYHTQAGDDAAATGRGWLAAVNGDGSGLIGVVDANPFAGSGENMEFWRDLKHSGLLSGNAADTGLPALPDHSFGGKYGVTQGNTVLGGGSFSTLLLCAGNVSGKAAAGADSALDDGVANTGSVRASVGSANAAPAATAATSYNETQTYTLCKTL